MKKRYLTGIMILLLLLSMVFPVFAQETVGETVSERQMPLLVDGADLLDGAQEQEVLGMLEEASNRHECDVAIVTVGSLEGKTAMEYADDFYDNNGYGYGEEGDGILFLISMEEHDWWMTVGGHAISVFTDWEIDDMSQEILPYLSDGDYYTAFVQYAQLCDEAITEMENYYDSFETPTEEDADDSAVQPGNSYGEPEEQPVTDEDGEQEKSHSLPRFWLFVDFGIGFIIALVLGLRKRSFLNGGYAQVNVEDYEIPGSFVVTQGDDQLVNTTVTTRKIEKKDNDSNVRSAVAVGSTRSRSESRSRSGSRSSTRSSTHTTSSRTRHGGKGGKF
jgi:uncharacterized membrane protein YgcG